MKKLMFSTKGQDIVTFASRKIILIMMMTVLTINGWGQSSTACTTFPESLKVHCDAVGNGDFEYSTVNTQWSGAQLQYACPWYGTFVNAGYFSVINQENSTTPPTGASWGDYVGVNSAANTAPLSEYNKNYEGNQSSCDPSGASQVGEVYAGFYAFKECDSVYVYDPVTHTNIVSHVSFHTNLHSYLSQTLPCKLHAGISYDISFWVSLSEYSTNSVNHIGMYLSATDPSGTDYEPVDAWLHDARTLPLPYDANGEGQLAHKTAGGDGIITWGVNEPVIPQVTQAGYGGVGDFITTGYTNATGWYQITTGTTPFIPAVDMDYITIGDFGRTRMVIIQPLNGGPTHIDDTGTGNPTVRYEGAPTQPLILQPPSLQVNDHTFYYVDQVSITPHGGSYPAPVITTATDVSPCEIGNDNNIVIYNFTPAIDDPNVTYTLSVFSGDVELSNGAEYTAYPIMAADGYFGIIWNSVPPCDGYTINLTMSVCDCEVTGSLKIPACCSKKDVVNVAYPNLGSGGDITDGLGNHIVINSVSDILANPSFFPVCPICFISSTSPVTISGKYFSINGNFDVDADIRFIESDASMGPEAKIIVEPNMEFDVQSSHLHACEACSQMWNGIELSGGSSPSEIVSTSSVYEDADSAITSLNGGKFHIYESIFNKNFKGVVVNDFPFTTAIADADYYVEGSVFTCRDIPQAMFVPGSMTVPIFSIISSYVPTGNYPLYSVINGAYPLSTMIAPRQTLRSYVGIEVKNIVLPLTTLTFTSPNSQNDPNTFDYLDFGMKIANSNVKVYNSIFTNIYTPTTYHVPYLCTGVFAWDYKGKHKLTVGGWNANPNPYQTCHFYNFTNGVQSVNYNNEIINNIFENDALAIDHQMGILIEQGTGLVNNVIHNDMTKMNYGIIVFGLVNSPTYIYDNTVRVWAQMDATAPPFKSFGIMAVANTFSIASLSIDNNHIHLHNINNGSTIYNAQGIRTLWNSKRFHVIHNDITLHTPFYNPTYFSAGIQSQADDGGQVECNTIVDNTGVTPTNDYESYGIFNDKSTNTFVNHNASDYMATGVGVQWSSLGSQLQCNAITNSWNAFTFYNAILDPQLYSGQGTGNTWATCGQTLAGVCASALTWNYQTSSPVPSRRIGYLNILPPVAVATDGCASPGIPGCNTLPGFPNQWNGAKREEMFGNIVRGQNAYDTLESELKLRDSIYLYRQLDQYDTIMHLQTTDDSVYQTFYNYCKTRNIGQFEKVNSLLIASVFASIDSAKVINQNIVSENTQEDNTKIVNTIYLNKLEFEKDTTHGLFARYVFSSNDTAQLMGVAYQNPALGGKSVFMARALLWIDVMDDNTVMDKSLIRKLSATENKQTKFRLYPNPNNGSMILEYSIDEDATGVITIYDISGRVVKQLVLSAQNKLLTITANELDAGTYYYVIKVGDENVKADKLVIVK